MEINQQSQSALESCIRKAIKPFSQGFAQPTVTDLHIQPNQYTGELSIFDDEDKELSTVVINEWVNYEGDDFYEAAEQLLHAKLANLKDTGIFNNLSILKPYSFVLVDEEKESISDLLLIDDDTILIDDELLKGLDEELDSFLKDLLEK